MYSLTACRWLMFCILLLGTTNHTLAQSRDTLPAVDTIGNKLVLFPLAFYLPETSLGFGGAGAYTYRWKNQSPEANPSQVQFVLTYTLQNQILVYSPYKLYFGDNKYYVFGEFGFFKYFYPYFGIGPRTPVSDEETFRADYPRLTLNVTYQVAKNWFIGPSIWYDQYVMRDFEADGELIKGINGIDGGAVIGAGLQTIYDSRDNTFNPKDGTYADVGWLIHDKSIGSKYNFHTFDLSISKYFSISNHQTLAANCVYRSVGKNTPFYHLAQHGGPKNARGYILGRYRDRNMLTVNLAWRQHIKGRFSAVLFANYGGVSPSISSFKLNTFKPAVGIGIRFELDRINHLNLRLDYGIGEGSSEFYITVGEAF